MDKWLDQFTDNRTFMKLVALVLAILLFGTVYDDSKETNDVNVPGSRESETLLDIPLKSYYDTDNLVITGMPETVEVVLEGPTANLRAAKTQRDFEVYADLSKVDVGKQRVQLQIRDLSDRLNATINPAYVDIVVQEKVTEEYTVDVEFNHKMVAEGYTADNPEVQPGKVKITGGKDVMDKITYVKATIELGEKVNKTIDDYAIVTVLDDNLNKLNVVVEQETVKVTIPIRKISKTVPIEIMRSGTSPTGVTIDSIILDKNEATIKGNEDILDTTENVRVEVDVSKINENTELTLPVIMPNELKEVNPETVKAMVKVSVEIEETAVTEEEETTKIFSDIPIELSGIPENYLVTFQEPSSGTINLTVTGTEEVLSIIKETDFELTINAEGLEEGEHTVQINVNAPENVSWTMDIDKVNIDITEKELS
ncbi:YbbR-like domain-containing protein [Bacillus sp. V3B]|uniref:CdaR family protein n=1 Tax=Bacillus sp. V3B TaxID=2804915 RepID=UPI00210A240A|nr:CdaR family protein [Bacillus sp. V3B]MCQ6276795.1 YbbR-like domain-containing protein [Bacillus sp. V3B]